MKFNNAQIVKTAKQKMEKDIRDMVTVMGNDAYNFFVDSFRKQGFKDETLIKWKPRKKRERSGRGILIKTGALKNSLKKVYVGSYSVRISSDLIYARVHNEGLRAGRGAGFIMPKRQFIGNSRFLNRMIEKKIKRKLEKYTS
jgi:phage gpG-like protein